MCAKINSLHLGPLPPPANSAFERLLVRVSAHVLSHPHGQMAAIVTLASVGRRRNDSV